MKKQLHILILILVFACCHCLAQTTFQKTYGGSANDLVYCVQQTYDGGFIMAGGTVSFSSALYNYDFYLIKVTGNGDTAWTKAIGSTSFNEQAMYVQQNSDSGYIVCGDDDHDIYLARINAAGNVLWAKTYGGPDFEAGLAAQQTSDGGFIVAGIMEYLLDPSRIILMKTDANGNITWQKILSAGANNYDYAYSVQQTSDGGYIITGSTLVVSVTGGMSLIKTNSDGDVLWTKTYIGFNIGYSVQQTNDGGYIIAGSNYTTNNDYDAYLIKTNSTGDTLWTKAYGGPDPDYAYSVKQTSDGGYIVGGITRSFGAGLIDGYLVKTDADGNLLWSKAYGGSSYDHAFSAQQTNDGGYIVAGDNLSFGAGLVDVVLIKTDASGSSGCNEMNAATVVSVPPVTVETATFTVTTGLTAITASAIPGSGAMVLTPCISTGINETAPGNSILIFPNPATVNVTLTLTEHINSGEVEIFNLHGQMVYSKKIFSASEIKLGLENIGSGIYFVKVSGGEKSFCKKIIVDN